MVYFLGLGSNLGDKKENLKKALKLLKESNNGIIVLSYSSIYQSPALLSNSLDTCTSDNRPFFNMAVKIKYNGSCFVLLKCLKEIEVQLGRNLETHRWAPRAIDIDIISSEKKSFSVKTNELNIPHKEIVNRNFVLSPLRDLTDLYLKETRKVSNPLPSWMGIINLTPDSFSDSGLHIKDNNFFETLKEYVDQGVSIIDIGAESTRPKSTTVSINEEWSRLDKKISQYNAFVKEEAFIPKLSIDTRNYENALRALKKGVHMINDVSSLSDLRMLDLIKEYQCDYVLMHSLSIPPKPEEVISCKGDLITYLINWFKEKLDLISQKGISLEKIYIDPGIGFGKTFEQNLYLLKNIDRLHELNVKILVGHSRKSFISSFSNSIVQDRDYDSIGISLSLAQKGVDVIRTHSPIKHMKAYQGFLNVS